MSQKVDQQKTASVSFFVLRPPVSPFWKQKQQHDSIITCETPGISPKKTLALRSMGIYVYLPREYQGLFI